MDIDRMIRVSMHGVAAGMVPGVGPRRDSNADMGLARCSARNSCVYL